MTKSNQKFLMRFITYNAFFLAISLSYLKIIPLDPILILLIFFVPKMLFKKKYRADLKNDKLTKIFTIIFFLLIFGVFIPLTLYKSYHPEFLEFPSNITETLLFSFIGLGWILGLVCMIKQKMKENKNSDSTSV